MHHWNFILRNWRHKEKAIGDGSRRSFAKSIFATDNNTHFAINRIDVSHANRNFCRYRTGEVAITISRIQYLSFTVAATVILYSFPPESTSSCFLCPLSPPRRHHLVDKVVCYHRRIAIILKSIKCHREFLSRDIRSAQAPRHSNLRRVRRRII